MTGTKRNKAPELARWRYKIGIDVEETKFRAENRGFSCRLLEGLPKNKRGKDGWGEHYPLKEYEIMGGHLPPTAKIYIAPKTTQIFFFGPELISPSDITFEELKPFLEQMESLVNDLESTEKIMNELAAFIPEENGRFGQSTRTYSKVPAMYRLLLASKDTYQQLLDEFMKKFYDELGKVFVDIFRGGTFLAGRRLDALLDEAVLFQRSLIELAKEWKDPNAQKWEDDLNKSITFPLVLPETPKHSLALISESFSIC